MTRLVRLAGPADFPGWRDAARALALARVPAEEVLWRTGEGEAEDLFARGEGGPAPDLPEPAPGAPALMVPRRFVEVAGLAACHSDPERFTLLYRLLLRLQDSPRLMELVTDDDVARLEAMAKAVRRDRHKMTAFVRFKEVDTGNGDKAYVAWFEPEHHILALAAPFFAERFATMAWSIVTPEASAAWDGKAVRFGPGGSRADVPADEAGDALWRTYYASIFNPARLKVDAMKREMPVKYWKNLPEAELIAPLIRSAGAKEADMVAKPQAAPPKRAAIIARRQEERVIPAAPRGDNALAALAADARSCQRCPLYAPATQTVFGEGLPSSDLVFVGEQPGDKEDLLGKPFVGPAGALFDKALGEAGIDRARAYVTNAVKHFKFEPRGKRRIHAKPNIGEIDACRWWIEQELQILHPTLTVALGATAIRSLTGKSASVLSLRGTVIESALAGPVFVTVHPSFLLRLPDPDLQAREYAAFVADLSAARDLSARNAAARAPAPA